MNGLAPAPIGVFDSGVGGLTVLRALRAAMPGESFIYLGDTARLPYGTKSDQTVMRYSLQCAAALVARGIRALVVACNTVSASSLEALRLHYAGLPIIGVIEPGAQAAVAASALKRIAVIGTESTIQGGAYQRAIHSLDAATVIKAAACSLFVAIAEEGWTEGEVVESVARRYLNPLFGDLRCAPDTLVLGCTHFPVLANAIRAVLPAHVNIVDSAVTTAATVRQRLLCGEHAAHCPTVATATMTWLATDGAARFARVGSIFLGETVPPESVEIIDL